MKIVTVSDLHNNYEIHIPEADIFIDAGDFTSMGTLSEVAKYGAWVASIQCKHKILIPGNHDFLFQKDFAIAKSLIPSATILIDNFVVIEGIKIYGSPWQPFFHNWAFNLHRGREISRKWEQIPEDTDILVTHGPPFEVADVNAAGQHCGCEELRRRVLEISPSYHIFGHIHRNDSYSGREKEGTTTFLNSSIMDERYIPVNKPHLFEFGAKNGNSSR